MTPKKVKESPKVLSWQDVIVECQLSDDDWSVKVMIVEAAGSSQDRLYLQNFENYVKEDKRFVIKNICKTETVFMISQLGSDSRANTNNNKVFEEAQTFLRAKMDIPPENYALIIKQLIMKLKEDDQFIKQQKVVVQEGLRRESAAILNKTEIRGNKLVDPLTDEDTKKYNTKLRLRGEEWRNKVYVEDHPLDGPDLYVIITNFMDSELPTCLIKIGVPIAAIVQLRIDIRAGEIPPELILPAKRVLNETEEIEKASCYWNDLLRMRTAPDTSDFLKNTSFIVFTPPYWDTHKLSAQPEQIYDELCYLAYDIQDLSRQHTNFLDNVKIIEIPETNDDVNQKLLKFYYQQIDDIPLEYITMYSILDSILWTVSSIDLEYKSDSSVGNSEVNTKNNNDLHVSTNLVTEVFKTLCQTSENKKTYRITYGDELDFNKDPIVISYGDKVKCKTFMLGNINMDNIIKKTLTCMPLYQLWKLFKPMQKEQLAKINYHVNVLLSCFDREDIETTELCRLLHILAFRKIYNHRSLIHNDEIQSTISQFKNTYLKRSLIAEPITKIPSNYGMLSHSIMALSPNIIKYENESTIFSCCVSTDDSETLRIKTLFDCPDISELASAAEIACSCPIDHYIDDFDHFEDYKGSSAFQVLNEAYNTFNCINYKYCEVTDCIIMIFFNSFDSDNISREQWRAHLPTAVCLQDFFDYVLEEHMDWIKEEENKHDQLMKTLLLAADGSINQTDIEPKCIDDYDIDLDMVLGGSLKHQELIKNDSTSTVDQNFESVVTSNKETQSGKKSKTNISRQTITQRSQSVPLIPEKPFSGYDLGDRRLEAYGKYSKYYGTDGTRISSNYHLIIPMHCEWITLNLTPGDSYNEIWIHRLIRDYEIPIKNEANDIRITGKNGIIINIMKKSYDIIVPDAEVIETTDNNIQTASPLEDSQNVPLTETVSFHSLCITWPNGLIIEPVYEYDSSKISHIKLTYLKALPNLTEETRCVSLNGEVVVFQLSGNIDVLRPDGTFIKITKCAKTKVIPQVQEEEKASIISVPKGKKGKIKANKVNQDLKQSKEEIIPTTYELIIDEYDIIDPNGEVQRFKDNKFVFVDKLLVRTATDYNLGEIFSRRMDGTNILLNKDGLQIVTFPDGTRIITQVVEEDEEVFVEWTAEELELLQTDVADIESDVTKSKSLSKKSVRSFTEVNKSKKTFSTNKMEFDTTSDGYISVHLVHIIEHKNFATVTFDKFKGLITLDSPNNVSINVQFNNHFNIKLDEATTAKFDGNNLKVSYKSCSECKLETKCYINIFKELQKEGSFESSTNYWLKMKNSYDKMVLVNDEGGFTETDVSNQYEKPQCGSSSDEMDDFEFLEEEEKVLPDTRDHSKCKEPYENNNIKFFVVHRNLNCTELIRQDSVDAYQKQFQHHPWFSCNSYDSFGDHRRLISILTPMDLNESDKWLMESKLAGKPKNLTYKDLKHDGGKGFYQWMRPYKRFTPFQRKPESVLPSLPRAFILRTLEKQWPESPEKKGAKELIKAILEYRRIIECECETVMDVPIIDTRRKCEKDLDKALQKIAACVYNDLKIAVSDELQARAMKGITTKPLPQDEELSISGEEQSKYSLEDEEAMRRTLDKEVEMSSKLKRYWKQREERYKEELFYQYLLREGTIPPYFKNILAGALWWEIDQLAIKAVHTAERRKTVCTCEDERKSEKKVEVFETNHEGEEEEEVEKPLV